MSATQLIDRLHQHRMWVNAQLIRAARTLTNQQLHEPLAIGQGSIWKTLTHLMAAEYVWLQALQGDDSPCMPGDREDQLPGNQAADGAIASIDELELRWKELDRRWNDYLNALTDHSLYDTVYKVSAGSTGGRPIGTRRSDILLHVCTHAQYTTAQMVNMLRQVGATNLPDAMLITLARSEIQVDGTKPE